ncbi:MAG: FIST N-terminal domain-containing protein [Planctomycetota bacterium]|jgi:small ligand-binding sensory domain FIST|nr:FIST N-terminal domain-containing protein [Planctomycetota bacterium]
MTPARFASGFSTRDDTVEAVREASDELAGRLAGEAVDLLIAFVTLHHGAELEALGANLQRATDARHVVGCTGGGLIGTQREVEQGPALALWSLSCQDTRIEVFHIRADQDDGESITFRGVPELRPQTDALLLLGEPFTFPMSEFLGLTNDRFPTVPAIGGMASGGQGPGQNFLFHDDRLIEEGCLGVALEGGVELVSVVSQGCRPVGKPLVITSVADHLIRKLGGRKAAKALFETLGGLEESDRELFQTGPFLGVAVDANQHEFQRGDFLVRGVLGVQANDGAVAVADGGLRPGQTVQFMVRDAESAGDDLSRLMESKVGTEGGGGAGVLLFSCNGRGSRMFGEEPDHDIRRVQGAFESEVPAAGFFAMGEIGPVGGRNFLHGFTASVGVLRPRAPVTGP